MKKELYAIEKKELIEVIRITEPKKKKREKRHKLKKNTHQESVDVK